MRSVITREGIAAGVIGATSVAAWFLLVDLVAGLPLRTPTALGRAFFSIFGYPPPHAPDLVFVLGYTVFHYGAFIVVGLLAAAIVRVAETERTVLAGALILFVVFEVGFHLLLSIFPSFPVLGEAAWYNVAIGNLIAALAMGGYIWRLHPGLAQGLAHALRDEE